MHATSILERSCLNSFFLVLRSLRSQVANGIPFSSRLVYQCGDALQSFTPGSGSASGRSEETYFGALGAKKSTVLR
jgi:hypothetical protein